MTILLLCGYRRPDETEKALFSATIDRRISELKNLGLEVICVLAGEFADDQLRHCRRIISCELVFDTHDEPNIASNLRAGLAGTDGAGCFALPVEIPCPEKAVWDSMREQWRLKGFLTETNIYRPADAGGAPSHYGFPLLITRTGNAAIKAMVGFRSLLDTRLRYVQLDVSDHADLASAEQSL